MIQNTVLRRVSLNREPAAPLDYADSHAKVMSAIADLHIVSYDIVFSKDAHVLLRYSAEGSHCGQPHNGIEPSGRKAKWTAAAIFEVKGACIRKPDCLIPTLSSRSPRLLLE